MNSHIFKYFGAIILSLVFVAQDGLAQTSNFPYQQRDWATYMAPISSAQFDNQGSEIFYGSDNYLSYQINPYDSLAPYVSNPDYDSNYYLGKLNSDQTITFLKKVGQALSLDTLAYNYLGGLEAVDETGNMYLSGLTQASDGIATEGAYQSSFSNNWSDPYEVYYPELDITVTIPPELCKDVFIEKFNSEGEKIWGSYYNGNQDMQSISLIEQDGYLYLYGLTTSYEGIGTAGTYMSEWGDEIPHHIYRPFVMKIDANTGNVEWGTYLDTQVAVNTSNYIGNTFTVNSNGYCFYFNRDGGLSILDETGALSSMVSAPVVSHQNVLLMKADALGNIYIAGGAGEIDTIGTSGSFRPTKSFPTQNYILKINQSGEKVWGSYLFNNNLGIASVNSKVGFYIGKNFLCLISVTDEADLATPGVYQETGIDGQNNLVFFKMNATDGSLLWLSYYGDPIGEVDNFSPKISLDTKDNLYLSTDSGTSSSNSIITENALFPLPIDDKGGFTVKFIHENNLSVDQPEVAHLKLYPNPASQSITLETKKVFPKETELSIYDLLGRKIKAPDYKHRLTQTLDISNLSPGVYFLKIQNRNLNQSLKFVKKE